MLCAFEQVSLLDGKDVSVEERYRSESMFTGTAGGPMAGPMTGVLAGPPTGASAGMSMPGQPPYGPSHMQSSGGPSMQPPLMQTGMMSWQVCWDCSLSVACLDPIKVWLPSLCLCSRLQLRWPNRPAWPSYRRFRALEAEGSL